MAITAEFIGVCIAGIIITTATITVIGATITAITAIGETYRVAAVSKLARQVAAHAATFCLFANSLTLNEARRVSEQHSQAANRQELRLITVPPPALIICACDARNLVARPITQSLCRTLSSRAAYRSLEGQAL